MEDVPRSFIKNVALQISGAYKLDNAPYSDEEKDKKQVPFIGRVRHLAKFLEFLNGNSKKGVFLVTGFKGMGKTSFVNYVVKQYRMFDPQHQQRGNAEKSKIIPIHLTLTQSKPKEIDILRLLVSSVYDKYKAYRYRTRTSKFRKAPVKLWFYFWKLLFFLFLFLIGVIGLVKVRDCGDCVVKDKLFSSDFVKKVIDWTEPRLLLFLFFYLLIFLLLKLLIFYSEKKDSPNNRIKRLMDKCYASLSEENSIKEEFSLPYTKLKLGDNQKRSKIYPIAETKQIEYELQEFLRKVTEEESLEFIFIFDELDKVDPIIAPSQLYEDFESFENRNTEASYERDMREKKQAIVNIIAGLKNFFTTASARFIFIAGREMFDASLADIADRQSSISSIFTYIFNIESLLKEKELKDDNDVGMNASSLSIAIEAYLKELLFSGTKKISLYKASIEEYELDKNRYGDSPLSRLFFVGQCFSIYLKFVTKYTRRYTAKFKILKYFFLYNSNSPTILIRHIQYFIDLNDLFISEELEKFVFDFVNDDTHKFEIENLIEYIEKCVMDYSEGFKKKLIGTIESHKKELTDLVSTANGKTNLKEIKEWSKTVADKSKNEFLIDSINKFLNYERTTSLYHANKKGSWKIFRTFLKYRANFSLIRYLKAISEYCLYKNDAEKSDKLIKQLEKSMGEGHNSRDTRKAINEFFKPTQKKLYQLAREKYLPQNFEQDASKRNLEENYNKLYFTLQDFITYLTYRSNGSPQKLIKIIHDFILVEKNFEGEGKKYIVYKQRQRDNSSLYLNFDQLNQYRIGFINYLYRPFLIRRGRNFKLYSDNIIVSTPYLFDHLLRFHPFAFSLENLEMIPEVLSTNKTPSLRQHIKQIIDHLGANHIRETEISLFDYKFYSRTLNEISFLSKIFEQEAAAFNFTLDESYLVKLHIGNKIKGLRTIYYKFLGNSDANRQIFSISHLNEILGDLHFFDQEYDDAISTYSDGIKALGDLNFTTMDLRDFVTLIKNKLKLGLCFEKTNSYEEALALYSDCCKDAKSFMAGRLIKGKPFEISELKAYHDNANNKDTDFNNVVFYSSALSNQLQMILQGFLSKMFLQEKIGIEGISNLKLSIALGGFLKMMEGLINHKERNHLLKANAYMFVGKLWYFKNNPINFKLDKKTNYTSRILPNDFFVQIHELTSINEKFIGKQRAVSALSIYLLSIYEVLSAKNEKSESELVKTINAFNYSKYSETDSDVTSTASYSHAKVLLPSTPAKIEDSNLIKIMLADVEKRMKNKIDDESFRGVHYRYIGTLLSNIGDSLLSILKFNVEDKFKSFTTEEIFGRLPQLNALQPKGVDFLKGKDFSDFLTNSKKKAIDLIDVLKCYYLSGEYFLRYGRKISCSFQYNKILHVLRVALTAQKEPDKNDKLYQRKIDENKILIINFLRMLELLIVKPLLEIASETSGNSDTHMIKKAEENNVTQSFALNNISYHPESREVVLLYNHIAINVGNIQPNMENLISPYNTLCTQYARFMELDFYAKYMLENKIRFFFNKEDRFSESDSDLMVEYLFTTCEMLHILEIYDSNYALGFRHLAQTHYQIANVLKNCEGIIKQCWESIKKRLDGLLWQKADTSLNSIYHFQRAKLLLEKMIQLHYGGREYKKMIGEMIYLEDDFNDNAYHFGAALDRYFIVNGVVNKWLEDCDKEIKASNSYSSDAYLV